MQQDIEQEQYSQFISSAEKNSDNRMNQNNIYLTINLAFISYISSQNFDISISFVMSFIGIIICILWFCTIDNYSKRNKVKYDIINESKYGRLYKEEWKRISVLTSLTTYEKIGSIIFAVLYIILFILNIIK